VTTKKDQRLDPRLKAGHRRYKRPETILRKVLEFLEEPGRFTTREHMRIRQGGSGKAASWLRQTMYDLPPTACMCLDGAIRWFADGIEAEVAAIELLEPHIKYKSRSWAKTSDRSRIYHVNDTGGKRVVVRTLRRALGES
jgi:hypothetical protein